MLGDEPLDRPRDRFLAERAVRSRALTRTRDATELQIDLTLVMEGFDFEHAWAERREFLVEGTVVPTARLMHIIESKAATGRPKDQLFLATHRDALEQLLRKPDEP